MKKFLNKFWPLLVIFLLVMIFAYPYWAKGLIPFPSTYLATFFPPWQYYFGMPVKNNSMPDVVTQMYPWKHLVINLWKSRQWPIWNPYNFSGSPLLANYQSAVFHPANFLFFLFKEIDAWSLMILFQFLLAGWFTYLFCRSLKLRKAASLLGSISFMFCGFITCWGAYGTMGFALLFLPLVLYAIEKSFQKDHLWSLILIPIGLAASFFSGHFQISLYVLFFSVVFLFFKYLTTKKSKQFLLGLILAAFGIGLAMMQILPALELHQLSSRSSTFGVSEIIPFRYLITLMAPDFFGNQVTRNNFLGNYAEWMGFAGVIPLILAVFAVFRKRNNSVRFFLIAGTFALVMTLPTPILGFLVKLKIPVFSSSAASRIISLFSFSVAVLAGFGLEQLVSDWQTKKFKSIFLTILFFIGLISAVWLILLFLKPFTPINLQTAKRNFILPTGLVLAFATLNFIYWLVIPHFAKASRGRRTSQFIMLFLLVFLTAFDMLRFAQKWFPFDPKVYVYPRVPVLEFLSEKTPPSRVFGFLSMPMMNYFQILGFDGYDPVYIRRYGELLLAIDDGKIRLPSTRGVDLARRAKYTLNLVNLMGGRYLLHAFADDRKVWVFPFWEKPAQFKEVYREENKYQVYENLEAFPRAFMVYDYRVANQPQEIIEQMFSDIDLRKTLVLEEEVGLEKFKKAVNSKTEIISYTPNKVEIKIDTEKPGLLFLSDNYYPDWQALVDGEKSRIYRADYTFRAVKIPAGAHQVNFVYQPKSFKIGMMISVLLGLFMFILGLAVIKKRL